MNNTEMPRTILIIDDSPEDRYIFRRYLKDDKIPFNIVECATGAEGIARLQQQPVDSVLLDYHLPDMSGIEVLQAITRQSAYRPAVLILTGAGSEMIAVEAMKKGAQDYLQKDSITPQALRQALRSAMEKMELRRQIIHHQRELALAKRAAETANHAKTAFLASMSHELRTPLNAIIGFAQLIATDTNLLDEHQESLNTIIASGEHLLDLINNVLAMSRLEANRMDLREEAFDVRQLFKELHSMLAIRAMEKELLFNFHGVEELPPVLHADAGKLRQIMLNVLTNAIKYTDEGGVTLRVRFEVEDGTPPSDCAPICNTPGRLYVEVADSGRGIPPDEIDTIFEPFTQSARLDSTQEGAGLGLAITRSFVHMMGGTIHAESEVGIGTTFFLNVAAVIVEEDIFPAPEHPRQIKHLAADQPAPRILIAEDRETNRRLLIRLMQSVGFQVRAVTNGKEAVDVAKAWQPHLILMDADMPQMSGIEATRHIKTHLDTSVIVVALTASTFSYQRDELLAAGCDDYIAKPFRRDFLLERIGEYLNLRYEYNQPSTAPAEITAQDLTEEQIRVLDRDIINQLKQAVTELDVITGQAILENLRGQHPQTANILLDWLRQYRFDDLMHVIERWETLT